MKLWRLSGEERTDKLELKECEASLESKTHVRVLEQVIQEGRPGLWRWLLEKVVSSRD